MSVKLQNMKPSFDKLIVSLTTTPPRIAYLRETIASILNQSRKPDSIELNLPHVYRRKEFGEPDTTRLPDGIEVFRCDDDGPATKLLPTLTRYQGQNVCIIYCDDDRVYDPKWIERLVSLHEENPTACIAENRCQIDYMFRKRLYPKNLSYRLKRFFSLGLWKPVRLHPEGGEIVEGFGGVLVRPEFFDNEVFHVTDTFFMVDDIWFSAMLAKNQIAILHTQHSKKDSSEPVIVVGHDLGRTEGSLTVTSVDDMDRDDLNIRAIEAAARTYGIWQDSVSRVRSKPKLFQHS